MKKPQKGFSLIELLIVVAIILIIAAIAIPSLLHSRLMAKESSAVASLRNISAAQVSYSATYGSGYGTLAQLGTAALPCIPSAAGACLLDPLLSSGIKSGYTITAVPSGAGNTSYVSAAVPFTVGVTGQRTFCVDEINVIHYDVTGAAAPPNDVACEALGSFVGD